MVTLAGPNLASWPWISKDGSGCDYPDGARGCRQCAAIHLLRPGATADRRITQLVSALVNVVMGNPT
jgi:hypothetical protein